MLVIAHGLTVDGGNRALRGLSIDPPKQGDLMRMGLYYPYLCLVQVEETSGGNWKVVDSPIPPLTHLDVTNRIDPKFYNR